MRAVTIDHTGAITLPADLRQRYGLEPFTSARIVAIQGGLLLVPLTGGEIPAALQRELEAWQSLDITSWNKFPFEEPIR